MAILILWVFPQLLFLADRNCMYESKIKEIGVGIMDAYMRDFLFQVCHIHKADIGQYSGDLS